MATAGWRENRPLKSLVYEHYGRFNVFQLMRLMLWRRPGARGEASQARVPAAARVEHRLRFSADLAAAFPGHEISRMRLRQTGAAGSEREHLAGDGVVELTTPNFCVASALGPLPEPFTEWVRDLSREREPAMADFLDGFNQRMNVLRFHLKTRQTMGLNNAPPEDTAQARYLAALMGMAARGLAAQMPLPRRAWLGLAGLLGNARRSPFAITHVLSLFLGAKVELEQMVGAWQPIEPEDRIALGLRNRALGRQTVLGRRVWDPQARIRIIVAALPYSDFCSLLPPNLRQRHAPAGPAGGNPAAFDSFIALLRLLLDRQFDCEVLLEAAPASVPPRILDNTPEATPAGYRGMRLGETAWLAGEGPQRARAGYLVRAGDIVEAE